MNTRIKNLGLCIVLVAACVACEDDEPGERDQTSSGGSAGGEAGGGGAGGGAPDSECSSPRLDPSIEIAGAFRDGFDYSHRIDDLVWVLEGSLFHLLEVSNAEGWAIARNDGDNTYYPNAYSRFDWTVKAGDLYFCQTVFAADTEDDAREADPAEASDLETGCAGFPWSRLTPIELVGEYTDQFDGTQEVTPAAWISGSFAFHLLEFSNQSQWAVAQNDCDNDFAPGLYSRFDWVVNDAGAAGAAGAGAGGAGEAGPSAYYCQTGYDLASAEDARELEAADADDLESGCNGFPWSELWAIDL